MHRCYTYKNVRCYVANGNDEDNHYDDNVNDDLNQNRFVVFCFQSSSSSTSSSKQMWNASISIYYYDFCD